MLGGTQAAQAYKTWQNTNNDSVPHVYVQLGPQEQGCGRSLSLDLLLHSGNAGGRLKLLPGLWNQSSTLGRDRSSAQWSGKCTAHVREASNF